MPPQTKEQTAMADKAAKELGFTNIQGARKTITPESTDTAQGMNIVSAITPIESAGLKGVLETPTTYTQDLAGKAETAQKGADLSFDQLMQNLLATPGETQLTAERYAQKGGVDELTKELNRYDQMLNVEQNALNRTIERLQENKEGLSDTQINNRVDEEERKSLRKQADIAVIRAGVAQDYSTAKAIADRAVAAQLEKTKLVNQALTLNYERNKDAFDKSEQRAFESAQADRERKLNKEEKDLQEISDLSMLALEKGASAETIMSIRNAKTPAEAQALAGNFMRKYIASQATVKDPKLQNFGTSDNPIWKQWNASTGMWDDVSGLVNGQGEVGLKKVPDAEIKDLNDTQIARNAIETLVKDMISSIDKHGTQVLYGAEAGKRGSAKTSLLLQIKNLEKTGALDQGTIDVLKDAIPSNTFFATEESQKAGLQTLLDTINQKVDEQISSYRGTTAEQDPRTQRLYATDYNPDLFTSDDITEIDTIMGVSTPQVFNPASYY